MVIKLFDANLLIEIIGISNFSTLFELWGKNPKYDICITTEVLNEILYPKTIQIIPLILKGLIKVLPPISEATLERIQKRFPALSKPDCSIYCHCNALDKNDSICLTTDQPLRKKLEKIDCEVHGLIGILLKLKNDGDFSSEALKRTFKRSLNDPRLSPNHLKKLL
ncbi:MAG: hypothetical protein ACTSQI_12390 [Candidatus Helarchaeota archaeon]